MVTKQGSDHLDLHSSALRTSTHTGKYFECGILEELRTGSFCSRRSGRREGTGIGRNSIHSQDQHRGSVVMALEQSDQSYMCTGSHQDGVLDMGSQWKDSDTHSYDGYMEVGRINGLFYSYLLILRCFHVFQDFVFSSRGILGDFTESPHS
jgi:hypothetical protein